MNCETELAWAAGFFDGEGHTFFKRGLGVQVGQYEPTTLERFFAAVGVGRIYGPYRRKDGKLNWTWGGWGQNGATALALLWPYLSEPKRQQAQLCLDQWNTRPSLRWNRRQS